MIKKIAEWILRRVDISVRLDEDVLNIRIMMGGQTLIEWSIDLIKDDAIAGVKHGQKKKIS